MSVFGEDRERFYADANAAGGAVAGPDGKPMLLGDRLRAYQSIPEDAFQFWVQRGDGQQRDGKMISREAIEGVAQEIAVFVMARAQLRVDEGYPPDQIVLDVGLQFSPEPPSPQPHMDGDAYHRAGTLRRTR